MVDASNYALMRIGALNVGEGIFRDIMCKSLSSEVLQDVKSMPQFAQKCSTDGLQDPLKLLCLIREAAHEKAVQLIEEQREQEWLREEMEKQQRLEQEARRLEQQRREQRPRLSRLEAIAQFTSLLMGPNENLDAFRERFDNLYKDSQLDLEGTELVDHFVACVGSTFEDYASSYNNHKLQSPHMLPSTINDAVLHIQRFSQAWGNAK